MSTVRIQPLLFLFFFSLVFFNCRYEPEKIRSEPPFKIGILAPYQGPGYRFLTDLHRGLDLAFSNAGDFHLIYENSDTATPHGKLALDKLIHKDKVLAIFGGDDPGIIRKIAEAANRHGVLYFPVLLNLSDTLSQAGFVFQTLPSMQQLVETLQNFLQRSFRGKTVSIIYQTDTYHHSLAGLLRESLLSQKIIIDHFKPYDHPLEGGPEIGSGVIFLLTHHESTMAMLDLLKEHHFSGPVIGSPLSVRYPIINRIAYDRYYCPQLAIRTSGRFYRRFYDDFTTFHARTTSRFPELFEPPPNRQEAQAYEAACLLIGAIRQAGTDPEQIRDYLHSASFPSLTGSLSFDQDGMVTRTYEIVRVAKGGFRKIP